MYRLGRPTALKAFIWLMQITSDGICTDPAGLFEWSDRRYPMLA